MILTSFPTLQPVTNFGLKLMIQKTTNNFPVKSSRHHIQQKHCKNDKMLGHIVSIFQLQRPSSPQVLPEADLSDMLLRGPTSFV